MAGAGAGARARHRTVPVGDAAGDQQVGQRLYLNYPVLHFEDSVWRAVF